MSNYSDTWKNVITNPTSFFEKMPKSGGYGEPLKFAIITSIIGGIELFVLMALRGQLIAKYAILFPIAAAIGGAIGIFIGGAIYFILFKIVGGKGSYEGSVRLVAYAGAPVAIIIIPFLPLYVIYLIYTGGKHVHNVSKSRAAIAVLLPVIVVGAVTLLSLISVLMFTMGGTTEQAPMVSIRVSSATAVSIELSHQGGDMLELSDVQFTVKKANGEVLKPSVSSKSGSNTVYAGDTIRLYGANFGKSGDNIEITGTYKNKNVIFDTRTQIK